MMIAGVDIGECIAAELVGSRVTCSPPPTDTDQDILVLVSADQMTAKNVELLDGDWELGGSVIAGQPVGVDSDFRSYRYDDLNIILTCNREYYDKFLAATSVAKRLNLMNKNDRIALFGAVLYADECQPRVPEILVFNPVEDLWA